MTRGVSVFSVGPSRKTVDSPMFFEAFTLSRFGTITFSGRLAIRLNAARSVLEAIKFPLVFQSALEKSARIFHWTLASIELTSRSSPPPWTVNNCMHSLRITSELPRFEHVGCLRFLDSLLQNFLASAGYRDCHGKLTSLFSSFSLEHRGRSL